MRIYLDACCVNRLTDDQFQKRVREEAEAVERILRSVKMGESIWIISAALIYEIERSPQEDRKRESLALLALSSVSVGIDDRIVARARDLESAGYGGFDALHLASAEAGDAEVLLTTDDKFVKRARRGAGSPRVPVRNPVSWLKDEPL